ncbi:MAG: hypothetical protein WAZ23_02705, partial [Gemmiger qucibialis]
LRHGICVAKMLDKTSSIICAFGLASAAPRSPYRHLELCGIALKIVQRDNSVPLYHVKQVNTIYNPKNLTMQKQNPRQASGAAWGKCTVIPEIKQAAVQPRFMRPSSK